MLFMSLHVNGGKGSGRAEVFACSATDAALFVDDGYHDGPLAVFVAYHLNGPGGTMTCAVAAVNALGGWQTVFAHPDGVTDLYARLLGFVYFDDGAGRTHFGTTGTLRTAVAVFVAHFRLHEAGQVGGGFQYLIRTL